MKGSSKPPIIIHLEMIGRTLLSQPKLVQASYASAFFGTLISVHDYHHPKASFGYSTPLLGAAIVLYLLGSFRKGR